MGKSSFWFICIILSVMVLMVVIKFIQSDYKVIDPLSTAAIGAAVTVFSVVWGAARWADHNKEKLQLQSLNHNLKKSFGLPLDKTE